MLPSGRHVALPMSVCVPRRRVSPRERLEDGVPARGLPSSLVSVQVLVPASRLPNSSLLGGSARSIGQETALSSPLLLHPSHPRQLRKHSSPF